MTFILVLIDNVEYNSGKKRNTAMLKAKDTQGYPTTPGPLFNIPSVHKAQQPEIIEWNLKQGMLTQGEFTLKQKFIHIL